MSTPPVWTPWSRGADASNNTFWTPPPAAPLPPISDGQRALAAVSDVFGVSAQRIRSQVADRAAARPRQALCYVLREELNWTLPRIGRFVRRDHTTVLYSVAKVCAVAAADPDFAAQMREVLARVGGA